MNCKTTEFDLRLTFSKNTKDPSRLFRAMAKSIDAVNTCDTLFAKTIGIEYCSEIHLVDIEKGSLIARLNAWIKGEQLQPLNGHVSEEHTKEYVTIQSKI